MRRETSRRDEQRDDGPDQRRSLFLLSFLPSFQFPFPDLFFLSFFLLFPFPFRELINSFANFSLPIFVGKQLENVVYLFSAWRDRSIYFFLLEGVVSEGGFYVSSTRMSSVFLHRPLIICSRLTNTENCEAKPDRDAFRCYARQSRNNIWLPATVAVDQRKVGKTYRDREGNKPRRINPVSEIGARASLRLPGNISVCISFSVLNVCMPSPQNQANLKTTTNIGHWENFRLRRKKEIYREEKLWNFSTK